MGTLPPALARYMASKKKGKKSTGTSSQNLAPNLTKYTAGKTGKKGKY